MRRLFENRHFVAALLSALAFIVYLLTLAPTVTFIDSGELAAVATTLGVAHPTGYPLFTLIGWLFAHLPLAFRTISQLNLMSAVFCSLAVFVFFHLFVFLLSSRRSPERSEKKSPILLSAACGALALAFSETFWSQAVELEVYSMHILFIGLILLLFLRSLSDKVALENPAVKLPSPSAFGGLWYGFALVLGLSFTNHMTTILLAPAFLYLFFAVHRFSRKSWRSILRAVPPFLLGFSVYLYLPIRAAQDPLLNWGNPTTLERFWWHFTGKQYRVWIFSSMETAKKQFEYFLETFPSEFAYVGLGLALIGAISLLRLNRKMFLFTLLLFVSCVFYSINYDIHDIDSYFLLAYVVTAIWIAFGAQVLIDYGGRHGRSGAAAVVCIALCLAPLVSHYEKADQSENYAVEDYAMNMFDSFEENAIVLSYQWDYWLSASYYYQLVEGRRKDVVVLDKELFRRSWYFKQIEQHHPWLIERSRKEVDEFLAELYKFEHNLPYNPALIQARFEALIQSFLMKNYADRPLYVTSEIEPEFVRGFQKVPAGIAFRLTTDTTYQSITPKEFAFRPITKSGKYSETIRSLYASAYTNQAVYLAMGGDGETAKTYLAKALEVRPGFSAALTWLQRLGMQ